MESRRWICILMCAIMSWSSVAPRAEGRAFFVFGDSLVDNGNNNYLATTARADSYPYGIDSPSHRASGRFSNGLNIPDIISEKIGSEPTLPYLSPELNGEKLLVGANFASAGIGILNDTGIQFINIIRIGRQLQLFEQYQQRVSALIGEEQAGRLVNEALVLITLGGNDFVNNYYLVPFSARSRQFALPDYVVYLISEYRKILARLYELGARRVLVTGTGPIGCVPAELALHSRNGECYAELQRAAGMFNPQLVQLLTQLNSEIGSDVFISADAFAMHMDFISDPQAYEVKRGWVCARARVCRICDVKGRVLWTRAVQWDRTVHSGVELVPEQGHICILGSLSSQRESQPTDRRQIHDRIHPVHEPHEPQHHLGFGF
ncbi:GDSL esterase/lipase At5g33370-like isoform X2 [Prosopis cineraria]|uniref:GDSL esterase/lipase At5g33370-like isoform X2 n=1 Tax=Prosopis cineraria TaxID=364024 RepID=UPI00240F6D1C|nr:GDSL esterase/lipase At5g33370-like isoform X2 [Prosopis cineraria]